MVSIGGGVKYHRCSGTFVEAVESHGIVRENFDGVGRSEGEGKNGEVYQEREYAIAG